MTALSDRFRTTTDPYGKPWEPSLRATLEGGQTLSDTGRLRRSFNVANVSERGFVVATNVQYAAPHQYGATIRPRRKRYLAFRLPGGRGKRKGGKGAWVFAKQVTLPARPFFPWGNRAGEYGPRMEEAIRAYLETEL
jgi:phage gpG-like protein